MCIMYLLYIQICKLSYVTILVGGEPSISKTCLLIKLVIFMF